MTRARELANFADNTAGLESLTVADITDLTATATELNYTDGVGSALQTQIDAKLASSSYTASDVLTKIKTVDGDSSGLDADLLDGVEASSFLRSDATDTATGTITFSGTSSAPFRLQATNSNSSWDAVTFQATTEWGDSTSYGVLGGDNTEGIMLRKPHVVWDTSAPSADIRLGRSGGTSSGAWVNMGVKQSNVGFIGYQNNNVLTWGSSNVDITNGLTVAGNTAWHAGNDGSGSGLDADTVDGIQASSFLRSDTSDTMTAGTLNFHHSGVQAPTATDATTGARLNLYPIGSGRDYSIGIGPNTMWFNSDDNYKWYSDGSLKFEWDHANNKFKILGSLQFESADTNFHGKNQYSTTSTSGTTMFNVAKQDWNHKQAAIWEMLGAENNRNQMHRIGSLHANYFDGWSLTTWLSHDQGNAYGNSTVSIDGSGNVKVAAPIISNQSKIKLIQGIGF